MHINLTADLHLTTRAENPERFSALEFILSQMQLAGHEILIIAGDLFDASVRNCSEFDAVCKHYSEVRFYIIPGNHDLNISGRQIVSSNVTVFTHPEVVRFDSECHPFLFLPYENNKTMGARIAEFSHQLPSGEWVLVAHGDYLDGLRQPNPYEDGLYMPLTRRDITTFRPEKVFLGHVHANMDKDPVYYTGSPCGLDISETGRRRYLNYEPYKGTVESKTIKTDVVFHEETITILPMEDETIYLEQKAHAIIQGWGVDAAEYGGVRLRLKVNGYLIFPR